MATKIRNNFLFTKSFWEKREKEDIEREIVADSWQIAEFVVTLLPKMKKTLIFTILSIAALIGASMFFGTPTPMGMRHDTRAGLSRDSAKVTAHAQTLSASAQTELDYYLERHNVQDEGYEMVVAYANGKRHEVELDGHLSPWGIGTWRGHRREGLGFVLDSLGRTAIGHWEADTLSTGMRIDTVGIYIGDFCHTKAEGHGAYISPDGYYFEGHWQADQRNGFGLEMTESADNEAHLRVGEWTDNRHKGERMMYTTERIYGIDIARYQHGKGRKKYNINWNQMRITFLGNKGHKNVSGTADYPVSFIFIKSTEGITIRNPYYTSDYQKARQQGIRVGAYHFYSVRTSGAAQAKYFLDHTLFRQGDLPPVLDVEPSDLMIRQVGGTDQLFNHIRTWLRMVEAKVGVKPIIYVNQRFVNNYLSQAPDIKRDYRVWIARYGEYRPDVHLAFWQLCPDGRVAGIKGDVDINVFNGYRSQFEEFLEEETIK